MVILVMFLFVLPFVSAIFISTTKGFLRDFAIYKTTFLLSILSAIFYITFDEQSISISFGHAFSNVILVLDFLLLGFFYYQATKNNSLITKILTLSQLALLVLFVVFGHTSNSAEIVVDKLSSLMFLLINIAGGLIAVYGVGYMRDEECSEQRKSYFLALLVAFLGVMNLVVSCDNLEWFFFFFEMTTLFSFLLIGFRSDSLSKQNAFNALRLNLYGGLALALMLVVASVFLNTISLSDIITFEHSALVMLSFGLFCFAAIVKGAQPPFSNWLLGAMVAPTPVSAILHSSTMVKVAPFMMLKVSSALNGTFLAIALSLVLLFSFLVSAIMALKEDNFKKILAYSTISLLGLMMALALYGSTLAIIASLLLVVFHGVSKALLFLQAGILEKRFHIKSVEDFGGLFYKSKATAFLILFGFLSIVIPPFGAFLAKWLSLEAFSLASGLYLVLSVAITAVGGVVLTLLYFKVSHNMSIMTNQQDSQIKLAFLYSFPSWFMALILFVVGILNAPIVADFFAPIAIQVTGHTVLVFANGLDLIVQNGAFYFWQTLLCSAMLLVFSFLGFFSPKSSSDTVSAYYCAEKKDIKLSAFYFHIEFLESNSSKFFALALSISFLYGVFI